MTDFSIRSESNPKFHLDVRSWPDSVVQLAIHVDDVSHYRLAKGQDIEAGAALALQLNPTQIRELIDHLEPFAAERELRVFGVLDQTSDLCGSGDKACPPKCCQEPANVELPGPWNSEPIAVAAEQESILAEAERIVHGPRRASYGHPARNFGRIAALWNAYIEGKDGSKDLDATDVAMMMILLKMARILHSKDDRDGHTDIVGYAACSAIINGIDPS